MLVKKNFKDLVDFSRGSTATGWVDGKLREFAIDEPRFVTDPATGYSGLLLEPVAQTNLLATSEVPNGLDDLFTYSGDISATNFDGLFDGTGILVEKAETGNSYAHKRYSLDEGKDYTFSLFVRMMDGGQPVFGKNANSPESDFALVFESQGVAGENYEVQDVGSGLFRISTNVGSGAFGNFGVIKYQANTDRSFKVSGYQLVEGPYVGSYTPTGASQVTRAGDRFILPTDRFDYRPDRGTLLVDAMVLSGIENGGKVAMLRERSRVSIGVPAITGSATTPIRQAGVVDVVETMYAEVTPERLAVGSKLSSAISWEAGGFVAAVNGAVSDVTPYTGDYPIAESLRLATLYNGDSNAGPACIVRRVLYYPERLPDAQLAALTELT